VDYYKEEYGRSYEGRRLAEAAITAVGMGGRLIEISILISKCTRGCPPYCINTIV
jgi:hypothetical protein